MLKLNVEAQLQRPPGVWWHRVVTPCSGAMLHEFSVQSDAETTRCSGGCPFHRKPSKHPHRVVAASDSYLASTELTRVTAHRVLASRSFANEPGVEASKPKPQWSKTSNISPRRPCGGYRMCGKGRCCFRTLPRVRQDATGARFYFVTNG